MFYHVIRRPLHSKTTDSSNQPTGIRRSGSISSVNLMPRYHYSRTLPKSATNTSDLFLLGNHFDEHQIKPTMTATTANNDNNNNNSYSSFKSTFIPFVTNNPSTTTATLPPPAPATMREFIQIPITREDGPTTTTNHHTRSVPITYVSETNALSPNANNNEPTNLKTTFNNFSRPGTKYFQHHFNNLIEDPIVTSALSISRFPSLARRLSLSIPVMTTTSTVRNNDDNMTNPTIPISPTRQISIRFPHAATVSPTPANTSRVSSAILRSSPISHANQRRKTDITHASSTPTLITINNSQSPSPDVTGSSSNILPLRRAEAMAREAISNLAQQRNNSMTESRVIINLQKTPTASSSDNQVSSAMKLPPIPSSSRTSQRPNMYHVPVLHELQMSSHSSTPLPDASFQSVSVNNTNNGNYKNEFRMEIPVTVTTGNDQENQRHQNYIKEDGFLHRERMHSTTNNSNQMLKSILKRSSSRETVSRKNVSFMNA